MLAAAGSGWLRLAAAGSCWQLLAAGCCWLRAAAGCWWLLSVVVSGAGQLMDMVRIRTSSAENGPVAVAWRVQQYVAAHAVQRANNSMTLRQTACGVAGRQTCSYDTLIATREATVISLPRCQTSASRAMLRRNRDGLCHLGEPSAHQHPVTTMCLCGTRIDHSAAPLERPCQPETVSQSAGAAGAAEPE